MIKKADMNGIYIKKFFKTELIPYSEIQSIVNNDGHTYVNNKNGDTYDYKFSMFSLVAAYPVLYDYIEKYNISYKDEAELSAHEHVYTIDEARQTAEKTIESIRRIGDRALKEKLGPEYSLDLTYVESSRNYSSVYMSLLKDGSLVSYPAEVKNFDDDEMPGSFDSIELFVGPLIWDTETRSARYGLCIECRDEQCCEDTVLDMVDEFCDSYKTYISENI